MRVLQVVSSVVAWVLVVGGAAFAQQGGRQEGPGSGVREVFPAGSLAVVEFAGLRACVEAAEELGVGQIALQTVERVGADRVRMLYEEHLEREVGRMGAEVRASIERWGVSPGVVRAVLQGRVALGIGRPTMFGGVPMPSVALAVDAAGREQEIEQLLAAMERALQQAVPGLARRAEELDGTAVEVIGAPGRSGALLRARAGRWLLLANSRGYLRECLAASRGEQDPFGRDPAYVEARDELAGEPLLSVWVNTAPLVAAPRPLVPYEVSEVLAALGLAELDGVYAALGTAERASVDGLHVGVHGPADGLLRAAFGRPLSFEHLRLCPADTVAVASMSVDVRALPEACARALAALPVELRRELEHEVVGELRREVQRADVRVDELAALAGLFGPELTVAVSCAPFAPPELLCFADVTDARAAEELLVGALARADVDTVVQEHRGTTILRTQPSRELMVPYAPAFALHGKLCIAGSSYRVVRDALNRMERAEQNDVVPDRHLAAARGASAFLSVLWGDSVARLWRTLEPWVEQPLWQSAQIDLGSLPSPDELRAQLVDTVVTARVGERGITLRSVHPLGGGALVALAGVALDELLADTPPRKKVF